MAHTVLKVPALGAARVATALVGMVGLWGLPVGGASAAETTTASLDRSVYVAFGGEVGMNRLVEDFVGRLTVHPELRAFFKDTNLKRLKQHLFEQFCRESGGGCEYTGDSMKESHQGLGIAMKDYNRLVEVLQESMAAQKIPFNAQLRLLARLAPMYRDIVER